MKKLIRGIAATCAACCTGLLVLISAVSFSMPNSYSVIEGDNLTLQTVLPLSVGDRDSGENSRLVGMTSGNKVNMELKLFGFVPVKEVSVQVVEPKSVIPAGTPFGVKMFTQGVIVVGLTEVPTKDGTVCPAKEAGIRTGDVILKIDGHAVGNNEDIADIISKSEGRKLKVEMKRKDVAFNVSIQPALSQTDTQYKGGMWVRDSSAGIGTITYYDSESGSFGGLGHAITDVDTGEIMPLSSGEVVDVDILGAVKGKKGTPGELKGAFRTQKPVGSLLANRETGVFGKLLNPISYREPMPVAMKQDVKEGEAKIICTVDENIAQEFDIKIERVNLNDTAPTKNMVIKVTDPRLLEKTGGIVQGMSGSPIIQDGKVIGAVTHVFVNDSTKGYGIFIENMLKTAATVNAQQKAS